MATKERLLTGLQSSGALHIGNYFGSLKPFVDQYEGFESFLFVADYHALTSLKDGSELSRNITDTVRDYHAVGVDERKATLFQQSQVPQHTELAWIFECLVTVPFLMHAHAYKDKVGKGLEANAGLFNYPMLMAADILLYDTDVVPVGEDQRQHIEYAREAAYKFNGAFGEMFRAPRALILEGVGTVPGTDGQKMSKSYDNTIPLFGTKDAIAQAVMRIVTDSAGAFPEHVYAIHKLFRPEAELKPLYDSHRGNYKALKEILIEDIEAYIAPMRERRDAFSESDARTVLARGSGRAREIAEVKMQEVRKRIGVKV